MYDCHAFSWFALLSSVAMDQSPFAEFELCFIQMVLFNYLNKTQWTYLYYFAFRMQIVQNCINPTLINYKEHLLLSYIIAFSSTQNTSLRSINISVLSVWKIIS